MYKEKSAATYSPTHCPCSTIGAAERSRLFFELRWRLSQEAVSGAIQVYATLISDAGAGVISAQKRVVITSVFAMKRVEPTFRGKHNKKPPPENA